MANFIFGVVVVLLVGFIGLLFYGDVQRIERCRELGGVVVRGGGLNCWKDGGYVDVGYQETK